MILTVKKYGNSLVIPINKSLAALFAVDAGTEFKITPDKILRLEAIKKIPSDSKPKNDPFWDNVSNASLDFWNNPADDVWDTFYTDKI